MPMHIALIFETLTRYLGIGVFDDAHNFVHEYIVKKDGDAFVDRFFNNFSLIECISSGFFVGNYQSPGSKQNASKITNDDDENIGQLAGIYLSQYGSSGSPRWFAIIIGTKFFSVSTKHICVANVARIVIFFSIVFYYFFHFVSTAHRDSKRQKFT